jgi:hypothetical protein
VTSRAARPKETDHAVDFNDPLNVRNKKSYSSSLSNRSIATIVRSDKLAYKGLALRDTAQRSFDSR